MTIAEAIEKYSLGSVRTLKRRLAATGLPEGERTRDGSLTPEAERLLAEMLAPMAPAADTVVVAGPIEAAVIPPPEVPPLPPLPTVDPEHARLKAEVLMLRGQCKEIPGLRLEVEKLTGAVCAVSSRNLQLGATVALLKDDIAARERKQPWLQNFLRSVCEQFGGAESPQPAQGEVHHRREVFYSSVLRRQVGRGAVYAAQMAWDEIKGAGE